jgi:hypothetical protein
VTVPDRVKDPLDGYAAGAVTVTEYAFVVFAVTVVEPVMVTVGVLFPILKE